MMILRSVNLVSNLKRPFRRTRFPLETICSSRVPMSISRATSEISSSIQHELDSNFFGPTPDPLSQRHLIVLNYTLPSFTPYLWPRTQVRVLGDGGANRLYDLLPRMETGEDTFTIRSRFFPDAICGDLDSIRSDVRHFYESQGVEIRDLSFDQDSTDTEKCIHYVKEKTRESQQKQTVLVVGALGGRLDHTLANLNTLHRSPELDLVMIGEGNGARLIKEGRSKIRVDSEIEGPKCAIVPLNGPVRVTATGLKWPLDDHLLEFTGLISTSNALISDVVMIQTTGPVLWITSLNEEALLDRLKQDL